MFTVMGWEMARLPHLFGVTVSLTDACLQAHLEQGRRCGAFTLYRIEVSHFAQVSWFVREGFRFTYRQGLLREGLSIAPFVLLDADMLYRIEEIGSAQFIQRSGNAIRYSAVMDGRFGLFVAESGAASLKLVVAA